MNTTGATMKIIPFPNRKRPPLFPSQQAKPLGLYLVLAFILLYLVSVWLVQQYVSPRHSRPPSPAATVAVTSPLQQR